ncbi:Rv3235 family protein [Streptomyces apocyni]|uniref:Rv3235 family protein n=1 Tax=Streptomyces apocyni TaxID=2654677 RepID=UPI0012E9BB58|nr:Rv3235 family protein [Streptomyces apocyni]
MNKIMTSTRRPGTTRPPTRADARRPSSGGPTRAPLHQHRRPPLTTLFTERLLAVLSGQRPVHWMLRHTSGQAYDDLARLAEHTPLRATGHRAAIRDIGHYVPRAGAIEVFARISADGHLHAMAFRLEQAADLRWRCTAVEVGGRGPSDRQEP